MAKTILLEPKEIAILDSAAWHQRQCIKCSRPKTTSPKVPVCMVGLLHYAKAMTVLRDHRIGIFSLPGDGEQQ